ncbi:MAG: NUDIX domain-containing protein, partial [Gammaproteobacteria bacterium]
NPDAAIRREVLEETGLIVEPARILGVFGGSGFRHVYRNGDCVEYTIVLFHCRILDDDGAPADTETLSLRYFDRCQMPKLAFPYPLSVLFEECPK